MVTVHIKENSIDGEELLKTGKLNLVSPPISAHLHHIVKPQPTIQPTACCSVLSICTSNQGSYASGWKVLNSPSLCFTEMQCFRKVMEIIVIRNSWKLREWSCTICILENKEYIDSEQAVNIYVWHCMHYML